MPKNKAILTGKDGRPSMKGAYSKMTSNSKLVVRRRLIKTGKEYFRVYKDHVVHNLEKVAINAYNFTNSIVVRWGNRIEVDLQGGIVYNESKAIANACDKKKARVIMAEAGVKVPKMVTSENVVQADLPVIARPFQHAKGKNFIVLKTIQEVKNHYNPNRFYYSAFVNKVKEFRIHVGHSKVLNYLEKPNPNNGNIAWNRAQNGEAFDNVKWDDYNLKCGIEAIKAVKALGLDFGKQHLPN
jgi:glutathione synthase/RimK-type ligase-like ATP-grasp enzyme